MNDETRYEGFIASYKADRGFGFVQSEEFDRPLWFHYTYIEGEKNSDLYSELYKRTDIQNIVVTFSSILTPRGYEARQIRIVKPFSEIVNFLKTNRSTESNADEEFYKLVTIPAIGYIDNDSTLTQFAVSRIVHSAVKWNEVTDLARRWSLILEQFTMPGRSPDIVLLSEFTTALARHLRFEPIGQAELISSIPCVIQHLEKVKSPLRCFREAQNTTLAIFPDLQALFRAQQRDPDLFTSTNTNLRMVILLDEPDFSQIGEEQSLRKIVFLRQNTVIRCISDDEEKIPQIIGRNLRTSLSIERLQPYQVGAEYDEAIFSGRSQERERILSDISGNYAVYGGRKIGKTWFLKDICDKCRKYDPYYSLYIPFYVSLQSAENIEDAVGLITDAMEDLVGETLTNATSSLVRMSNVLKKVHKETGKIVLLALDELDDFLQMPDADKLFGRLRQLQQTYPNSYKFIFAGFKALIKAFSDVASNNPFANWIGKNHFPLGCLTEEDLQSLIVVPLGWAGFDFDDEAIIKTIFDLTSGHPYYAQSLCHSVVNHRLERESFKLTSQKVELMPTIEFFNEIFDIFSANLNPLQLLIGKIFSEHDQPFREQEIVSALKNKYGFDIPMKLIREELRILQACSVFISTPNGFIPVMQRINSEFFKTMGDDDLALKYVESLEGE